VRRLSFWHSPATHLANGCSAAGVLSERQKRDYQGARGKRRYVYADEAAQYWLVSNARLLQKTILASIRSGMVRNKELYRQGRLSSGWGCTLQFWRNGAQIGAIHIRAEQERIYLHSPRRSTGRQRPTADRPAAQGLLQQGRNAARFRYRSRCHCQERVEAVLSR
jgi:hypothetical protein